MKVSAHLKVLAAVLALLLPATLAPVNAQRAFSTLSGSIVRGAEATPLTGARLLAGDGSGEIYRSTATGDDGSFTLSDLPPSTYRLAVEADGGIYVVGAPVTLESGPRTLVLAVHPSDEGSSTLDDDDDGDRKFALIDNPLGAALTFLGMVVIVGSLFGDSGGSGASASPSQPAS